MKSFLPGSFISGVIPIGVSLIPTHAKGKIFYIEIPATDVDRSSRF
jgi:hypothetical protein